MSSTSVDKFGNDVDDDEDDVIKEIEAKLLEINELLLTKVRLTGPNVMTGELTLSGGNIILQAKKDNRRIGIAGLSGGRTAEVLVGDMVHKITYASPAGMLNIRSATGIGIISSDSTICDFTATGINMRTRMNMNNNVINNLETPSESHQAATKGYVDSRLKPMGILHTEDEELASKAYVDSRIRRRNNMTWYSSVWIRVSNTGFSFSPVSSSPNFKIVDHTNRTKIIEIDKDHPLYGKECMLFLDIDNPTYLATRIYVSIGPKDNMDNLFAIDVKTTERYYSFSKYLEIGSGGLKPTDYIGCSAEEDISLDMNFVLMEI